MFVQKNGNYSLFIMQKPKRLPHLDKRRKPTPCPGSHTGAADSVHHARPPQNQRTARPENTRSETRAQEVGRDSSKIFCLATANRCCIMCLPANGTERRYFAHLNSCQAAKRSIFDGP